jgi:hypothetical protein
VYASITTCHVFCVVKPKWRQSMTMTKQTGRKMSKSQ